MDRILDTPDNGKVKALVVVPTRELAMQIDQATEGFGYYTGVSSLAIYGGGTGKEFSREKKALQTRCRYCDSNSWKDVVSFKFGLCRFK